ncbi:helix-turn-helix transcriptional regulator [Humidisolicoccus flavus]|uniref:helix-turn-helix transcriptional regulator n=1 Tax=Humidisolicoccus flavus TaxID=3111414 RepID=UPI00324CD5A5
MTIQQAGVVPQWTLSDRLRKARELTGLEAQEFANEVGISRQSVSAIERGRTVPRELTLRAWALRSGVALEWLKTGNAPPTNDDGASASSVHPPGLEPGTR